MTASAPSEVVDPSAWSEVRTETFFDMMSPKGLARQAASGRSVTHVLRLRTGPSARPTDFYYLLDD